MPRTPAERAKRYRDRQKNDPVLKAQYLEKERNRKKATYAPIAERREREQRKIRRIWRTSSKQYRARRCVQLPDSPPVIRNAANLRPPIPRRPVDQRTKRGCMKVKKDLVDRQLEAMKKQLEEQKRLAERWKTRYNRVKEQLLERDRMKDESMQMVSSKGDDFTEMGWKMCVICLQISLINRLELVPDFFICCCHCQRDRPPREQHLIN
ncbi:uncharacterized protein LOC116985651 [Amblyraja radiata]|uniref:uncharacterized protein LOC116985651 n=1 Tax=Amblyraja radiata TaxID=386614 RepID=UPI001401F59E|nr:uncharacterized protein LOC116985651 [Amblyraja radiata]